MTSEFVHLFIDVLAISALHLYIAYSRDLKNKDASLVYWWQQASIPLLWEIRVSQNVTYCCCFKY